MDYKKNLKYFKSNDKHFYIGVAIMAVGLICFALYYFFWILFLPYHEITSLFMAIIGACIAFVPLSFRSSENEIDEMLMRSTQNYAMETAEKAGLERHLHPNIKPITVGNFVYDGEGVILRKGRIDSKVRSSVYAATAMVFTCRGIYIKQKRFSLTEKSMDVTENEFAYTDIDEVEVVNEAPYFENNIRIKDSFIVINANGKEVFRIPTSNGSASDRLCEEINHTIRSVKNGR